MRPIFYCAIILILNSSPSEARADKRLAITAVGDVYVSKRMIERYRESLEEIDLHGDLVFANLEGVIASKPSEQERMNLKLTMPMDSIQIIKSIGVSTLSLANNHVLDRGPGAYREMYDRLKNKFHLAGYDSNGTALNIRGTSIRVIGFTFSGKNNVNRIDDAVKTIRSFHEDIIIVSAHMGSEGKDISPEPGRVEYFGTQPRGNVRAFSRACIDAGADMIIGHGPHLLRGMEIYRGRIILYSLGNFIFDYPGVDNNEKVPTCAITVNLNPDGTFIEGNIKNYLFSKGVPYQDSGDTAYYMVQYLSEEIIDNGGLVFNKRYPKYRFYNSMRLPYNREKEEHK